MIKAVGMFGSDAAAAKLHASLRNNRIHLERHSFQHPEDMLRHIAEGSDITAALLVERALKEINPEFTAILEAIRTAEPTLRIIFIADSPERNYEFEQWCYDRQIYDIAYPGRKTDVNIDAISAAILQGRVRPDEETPLPVREEPVSECEKRPGLLDTLKGISLPELKFPSLLEHIPKSKREKSDISPAPHSDYDVIGIINCSRGFGATTLAVNLAKPLRKIGHSVVVVAMDGSTDLHYSDLGAFGVMVNICGPDTPPDWQGLWNSYDVIIIDFGVLLEVLPSGTVRLPGESFEITRLAKEALDFCKVHLYLTSDEPWHRKKLNFVQRKPETKAYLVPHDQADAFTLLKSWGVSPK